ncbi:trigger factor, partial [bacterium]|nr:trigger factor [bacterium]
MKANIENLSSTKKKIKLSVPVDQVEESYKKAYNKVRSKAAIKGFRKGKVPDAILDKYYGQDLHMETLNFLVEKTFAEACAENQINPILQPKFDLPELNRTKEFNYSVEVEVKPDIEPKDYLEIPLKKKEVKIEKDAVDAELKRIQEGKASLKPADDKKTIEKGLTATIDFLGKVNGVPFQGGEAKGFMLEYGAGRFLKEFEDKMEGMNVGEARQIEITFPENYNEKTLAGKKATFDITLHALHAKDLPALDDELA